jgi:hypothetical protein
LSQVIIMVERNLGFEAEHHERALNGLPHMRFRVDHGARRYGILTTEQVKYGMMTLFNDMLRDQRVAFHEPLLTKDPPAARRKIQEQMKVYSFQYKQAVNCFGQAARRPQLQGRWHEGRRRHRPPARRVLPRCPGDVRLRIKHLHVMEDQDFKAYTAEIQELKHKNTHLVSLACTSISDDTEHVPPRKMREAMGGLP